MALESIVTKTRGRKAAVMFIKKSMKRDGRPETIVTDKLRSYGAALKDLGRSDDREMGRWLNNRAENSQLPFRRREWAMLRFRRLRELQKVRLSPCLDLQPLEFRDWLVRNGVLPTFCLDGTEDNDTSCLRRRRRAVSESARPTDTPRRNSRYNLSSVSPEQDHAYSRLFDEAEEKRRIVDLENAILDYALKFGVTDAARAAIRAPLQK